MTIFILSTSKNTIHNWPTVTVQNQGSQSELAELKGHFNDINHFRKKLKNNLCDIVTEITIKTIFSNQTDQKQC